MMMLGKFNLKYNPKIIAFYQVFFFFPGRVQDCGLIDCDCFMFPSLPRMFDPRVNLVSAPWSPFHPTPWLMPLLTELSDWRTKLKEIEDQLADELDVTFVADFPGEVRPPLEHYEFSAAESKLDLSTLCQSLDKCHGHRHRGFFIYC